MNQSEIEYAKTIILNGHIIGEERCTTTRIEEESLVNKKLRITSGESAMLVSVELSYKKDEILTINTPKSIKINRFDCYFRKLEDLLTQINCHCMIDVTVEMDSGNLTKMFYIGLTKLFKSTTTIDFTKEAFCYNTKKHIKPTPIPISFDLPDIAIFGVFIKQDGTFIILDNLHITEETSCDVLATVFNTNGVTQTSLCCNSPVQYDIIDSILIKLI
ncbi:hypothetical protein ECANGB1_1489 [Enterospora canceri]|uniref:Uncharacterized protein n=1 Tax=Enterospora canceri TaxID=1081671 RepID=A0A1Y1S5Z4_9MICR|nr:hypothetical protein ECANGB1_1489 [Enterospora canceri]